MSVLSNYKVKFGVKKFFDTEYEFIETISESLNSFIWEANSASRANQLLDAISYALENSDSNITYPAQSMMLAIIKKLTTTIYNEMDNYESPNYPPDFELPTSDFKIILEAWRDFLVSRGK